MTPATSLPKGAGIPEVGQRLGLKGSDAPALLQQLGLRIPALPNRVTHWQSGDQFGSGRCLRQGSTEFLLELDRGKPPAVLRANETLADAWTLIRSDHSLILDATWPRKLAHICSFDFDRLHEEGDLVVMTLMAGIGVTLVREPNHSATPPPGMALRLWCDPGYSTYLHDCLHSIGESR
jgi:hypothetical protein